MRVYDRALLRSSERIHGDPVERILDRFAIGLNRCREVGLNFLKVVRTQRDFRCCI